MKKFCLLCLSTALIFTLAACNGNKPDGQGELASLLNGQPESTASEVQDSEEEPVASSEEEVVKEAGNPEIYLGIYSDGTYDDETYVRLTTACVTIFNLSDESREAYPALATALDKLTDDNLLMLEGTMNELNSMAQENLSYGDEDYDITLYCNDKSYVQRADSKAVSFLTCSEGYYGGVHGSYGYSGITLDTATGNELKFTDVVTNSQVFGERIRENLLEDYPDLNGELIKEFVDDMISEGNLYNQWTLGYDKMMVYFSPYEIASYAEGAFFVSIDYSSNSDILNSDYFTDSEGYISEFPILTDFLADIDGDGKSERLRINPIFNEEMGMDYSGYVLAIDGEEAYEFSEEDLWCFDFYPYYVHTNNGDYLYIEMSMMDDYLEMEIVALNKGDVREVELTDETPGGYITVEEGENYYYFARELTDIHNMCMGRFTDCLSTQRMVRFYEVGSDGIPLPKTSDYLLFGNFELTLKEDVNGSIVGDDGSMTDTTLKAGTVVYAYRTDNNTYADVRTKDGQIIRIPMTRNEEYWGYMFNGKNQDEVFEGIMYAG